jgi:transposase
MNTASVELIRVERVDDLPVLWASLQRLRVAELLDERYPVHHLWAGDLSFGEVVAVWIAFLLSQGDHRLCRVQPWAEQNLLVLQAILGKAVHPLDFHDDRLADLLGALPQAEAWLSFEADLNRHTVRVYDLAASRFRLDATTANSHAGVVWEQGLIQFGHSKDRSDLPQLKVAVAALDPLGMPVATMVVPGNSADDPLYLPLVKQVQEAFGKGGKTYVSDCKAAALGVRACLAGSGDSYLCPLPQKQFSLERRRELIREARQGKRVLQPVFRPKDAPEDEDELVAEGFSIDAVLNAEADGGTVEWTERRWLVRSAAYAQAQQEQMEGRLLEAQEELARLGERKRGKRVLSADQMRQAAEAILRKHRAEGLLEAEVRTARSERVRRKYRGRPEEAVAEEEHRVEASRKEEAITEAKSELGWQVYATNDLGMSLAETVWSYRGQYRIEKGFSRLKGRPLSLTPMHLADEGRMTGLVLLLSVALRVLTLLEGTVRRKLAETKESLRGLYAGQAGRKTSSPSAELLLEAFKGISLTVVSVDGRQAELLTPLAPLQQKLLDLWGFPADLYNRLIGPLISKPPPGLSER